MIDRLAAVRIFADARTLVTAAAELFVEACDEAIGRDGRFLVALSGGSTPRGLYRRLASTEFRERCDWSRVEFFWGDERTVPSDRSESNFRMAREYLLDPLGIAAGQIHRMESEQADLDGAAAKYQHEIAEVCGVDDDGTPPALDLVLLGMGDDGHTASLFPHTAALAEEKRWVVANRIPQLSTDRLTMTVPLINRAKRIVLLVCGADKAGRLSEVLTGPLDTDRLPSQMIWPVAGSIHWLVDNAAAAALPVRRSASGSVCQVSMVARKSAPKRPE